MSFNEFYSQSIFKPSNILEIEKPIDFLKEIEKPLPVSFIINNTFFTKNIEKLLKKYNFIKIISYFNLNVYYISIHKKELKKSEEYKEFNILLCQLCEIGLVTRQEIVSMMPIHFLNILIKNNLISYNNLIALDMCASPGSKSLQLMNFCDLIISNDTNIKRLNILTTNISKKQRYSLRKSYTIHTSYDGKSFPITLNESKNINNGYNFILCDVPCSGDGTIKKNPHLILNWDQPKNIFNLQYRIIDRGVQIFLNSNKKEKYLIYSTCSMNPLENEFIIDCILKKYNSLELINTNIITDIIIKNSINNKRSDLGISGIENFEYEIELSNKQFNRIIKDFNILINKDNLEINNNCIFNKSFNFKQLNKLIKMKYNFNNSELKKCRRFMPNEIQGGFFLAIFSIKKLKKDKQIRIPNKPKIVNNLKKEMINLKNLDSSIFNTNLLLSNSIINNTLFELPKIYKKYIFPCTEFVGIIRAEKDKKPTSNLLIKNLEKITNNKKLITQYRLKNVNQLKDECIFKITEDTFIKLMKKDCNLNDLISDDLFINSLIKETNLKLNKEDLINILNEKYLKEDIFYLKLLNKLPIGASLLKYKDLIISCRISGKIEPYINQRECNLILYLLSFIN